MESREPPSGAEYDLAQQLQEAQEEARKAKETAEKEKKQRLEAEERAVKERRQRLEADGRAEKSEGIAEKERQQRLEAEERAEKETQISEKERRQRLEADERAEKERRQRLEADERAEKERRQRLEADERAEKERQQRLKAEEIAEKERRKTRPSTLSSYIYYNHSMGFQTLNVEAKNYSTGTNATSIAKRYYPRKLQPWLEFPKFHEERFSALNQLCKNDHIFESYTLTAGCPFYLKGVNIGNEGSCSLFCHMVTERPVKHIFDYYLQQRPCGVKEILFNKSPSLKQTYMDHIQSTQFQDDISLFPEGPDFDLSYDEPLIDGDAPNIPLDELVDDEQGPCVSMAVLPLRPNPENTNKNSPATDHNDRDGPQTQSATGPKSGRKRAASSLHPIDSSRPAKIHATGRRIRLDAMCFGKEQLDTSKGLFVVEYKPPQKMAPDVLRRILNKDKGTDDSIFERCIESKLVEHFSRDDPSLLDLDAKDKRQFQIAHAFVVKALVQTFHYMIATRIPYATLTTGECTVFLHHSLSEPGVLQYHLAVHRDDVSGIPFYKSADPPPDDVIAAAYENGIKRTAIALTSTLLALALEYDPKNDPNFNKTLDLPIWADSPSKDQKSLPDTRDGDSGKQQDQGNSSSHVEGQSDGQTSDTTTHASLDLVSEVHTDVPLLPYCTHECLLGLMRGGWLDEHCPNFDTHKAGSQGPSNLFQRHPITHKELRSLVKSQLNMANRSGFEVLRGEKGFFGSLVKITLQHYGYTFVAKATISYCMPLLRHEIKAYRRLESLQGIAVPVCLGHVHLDLGIYTGCIAEELLLLSYAGRHVRDLNDVKSEVDELCQMLRDAGVEHGDVREPNVVLDPESATLMLIDFDRAEFHAPAAPLLPSPTGPFMPAAKNQKMDQYVTRWKEGRALQPTPDHEIFG
ncbi:uncharacterized protein BROUX77_005860 [Berkeleyomyces rouxiae]|uniref:uncharacterized protein n=1 Tax=Berkeleyomyces rouxiae TaxID=2035830 RepID=UPI003B7F9836